jgi:DNA-3-methyladenine glycosylase I
VAVSGLKSPVPEGGLIKQRCAWVGDNPLYLAYHDEEWGVPIHDDRLLFEFLVLEGAQAGLSWLTILRKREGYRRVFAGFDPKRVAAFGAADVERLLTDPGIVRNRLKVEMPTCGGSSAAAPSTTSGGRWRRFRRRRWKPST